MLYHEYIQNWVQIYWDGWRKYSLLKEWRYDKYIPLFTSSPKQTAQGWLDPLGLTKYTGLRSYPRWGSYER